MAITDRQSLANFALRQLGAGAINIEVTNDQLADAIELAIQYYHECHADGIERDYLVHKLTGTTLVVADASIFGNGSIITSLNGDTRAQIADIHGNTVVIQHQLGNSKFEVGQAIINLGIGISQQTSILSITLGDVDNGYIPAGENIVGVKKILNITNILGSSDFMFNVQYQIMMSEIQNLTKAGTSYFYGFQNYLGHIDFIMKKEKNFRFNRRMNRLYLEIDWVNDVRVGDIMVAEIYRTVDPEEFPEVLDDIWLKKYTTALIKKQWGINVSKYQNVQLPGGITYNGRQIYEDAIEDITKLEDQAIFEMAPLEFQTG